MSRTGQVVLPLRILLGAVFAALLAAQAVAVPELLGTLAERSPELAPLRRPLLTCSVLGLACAQVVLACTWHLLTMVRDDRIFTEDSMPWVDAIVAALTVGWVLLLGVFVQVAIAWDGRGVPALLLLTLLVGAAVGLLVVVMRALLRQATVLRTDLDAVI